jgi:hypothetical protein
MERACFSEISAVSRSPTMRVGSCWRFLKQPRGDRGFVELLLMAREVGLEPLQVACELVLEGQLVTAAVVLNEMRRLLAPAHPAMLTVPDMLQLQTEPLADCSRYDHLRGASHVIH